MKPTTLRTTSFATALALAVVACGSSDSTDTPSTDAATTVPAVTEPTGTAATTDPGDTEAVDPLDVEFSSEPIEVGPILGDAPAASADESDDAEAVQTDAGTLESDPGDLPVETIPPFIPAPADAPFCALLEDLEDRPFPSDELEQLMVASIWFDQLRNRAVPEIVGDLDTLIEFIDASIESDGAIDIADTPDAADDAIGRLDSYVNQRCNGFGDARTSAEPIEE